MQKVYLRGWKSVINGALDRSKVVPLRGSLPESGRVHVCISMGSLTGSWTAIFSAIMMLKLQLADMSYLQYGGCLGVTLLMKLTPDGWTSLMDPWRVLVEADGCLMMVLYYLNGSILALLICFEGSASISFEGSQVLLVTSITPPWAPHLFHLTLIGLSFKIKG